MCGSGVEMAMGGMHNRVLLLLIGVALLPANTNPLSGWLSS